MNHKKIYKSRRLKRIYLKKYIEMRSISESNNNNLDNDSEIQDN